jgi:hypothetical protein
LGFFPTICPHIVNFLKIGTWRFSYIHDKGSLWLARPVETDCCPRGLWAEVEEKVDYMNIRVERDSYLAVYEISILID